MIIPIHRAFMDIPIHTASWTYQHTAFMDISIHIAFLNIPIHTTFMDIPIDIALLNIPINKTFKDIPILLTTSVIPPAWFCISMYFGRLVTRSFHIHIVRVE